MIPINTKTVIGPILVPNTPDCDYNDGEELLSYEKIEALRKSFKNYNIIDYQHQFTDEKQAYFMQNIGTPVRLFYNDEPMSFTDVTGATINLPSKTLWLESSISDSRVIQEIEDKEIVAYSVTVAEKEDAEQVMNIYQQLSTKNANKNEIDTTQIKAVHERISSKRTLIKDIKDPVLLTTSVVKFPCVNKAKFCINTLQPVKSDKMTKEETNIKNQANKTFIEELQATVNKYLKNNKETKDFKVEDVYKELEAVKTENKEMLEQFKQEILESIKATLEDNGEPNGVGYVYEKRDTEGNLLNAEDEPAPYKDAETVTNTADDEQAEKEETVEDSDEDTPVTNDDSVEETIDETPETEDEPEEESDETETAPKSTTAGKGNKSYKHEKPLKTAEPSAQKSRNNGKLEMEEKKMTLKRNEFDVIQDAVKGNLSVKGLNLDEIELAEGLNKTYENDVFLSLMNNKYATEVYKASFSEENTNKAILSTAVFATFVSKLIQAEPIFTDCNYETGLHGKGYIYDLGLGTYDTEDGHLPENFYFDNDPDDDEFDIDAREVRCYTQRRKVTISDRQRLANVYGDDLVNKVLEISRKKLFRGVYAARVWSDTTLANTVDPQYRRQNGLLKQAGQQLTSGTDFDTTKASNIFEALYYALPEEAQVPSDYVFYVPSNVHRAYHNEQTNRAYDTYIQAIGTSRELTWNDIPVKVSPSLNRADMKELVYNDDSAVLLTAPDNTNLFVGREAGIELKRNADTSSDTFYETIDTGVAYTIPDYAVVGTIDSDDYDALIAPAEDTGNGG